jgi:hypothetical protein
LSRSGYRGGRVTEVVVDRGSTVHVALLLQFSETTLESPTAAQNKLSTDGTHDCYNGLGAINQVTLILMDRESLLWPSFCLITEYYRGTEALAFGHCKIIQDGFIGTCTGLGPSEHEHLLVTWPWIPCVYSLSILTTGLDIAKPRHHGHGPHLLALCPQKFLSHFPFAKAMPS